MPPETRERLRLTARHEGLATVPDKIISAHDSAQQLPGADAAHHRSMAHVDRPVADPPVRNEKENERR
jgi:hypothetical protein